MPNQFLNTSWISMEVLRNLKNAFKVAEYFNTTGKKTTRKRSPSARPFRSNSRNSSPSVTASDTTRRASTGFRPRSRWISPLASISSGTITKPRSRRNALRKKFASSTWSRPACRSRTNRFPCCVVCEEQHFADCRLARHRSHLDRVSRSGPGALAAKGRRYLSKKRAALISSSMQTNSINTPVTSLFQPADAITEAFKEGSMGKLKTFDVFEEQNLYSQTAGTWAGAVTVTGAGQSGTSLIITGTAGDTFNQGDKFAIANVNFVNPRSRRTPGPLQAADLHRYRGSHRCGRRRDASPSCPPSMGRERIRIPASTRTWIPCPRMARH